MSTAAVTDTPGSQKPTNTTPETPTMNLHTSTEADRLHDEAETLAARARFMTGAEQARTIKQAERLVRQAAALREGYETPDGYEPEGLLDYDELDFDSRDAIDAEDTAAFLAILNDGEATR